MPDYVDNGLHGIMLEPFRLDLAGDLRCRIKDLFAVQCLTPRSIPLRPPVVLLRHGVPLAVLIRRRGRDPDRDPM